MDNRLKKIKVPDGMITAAQNAIDYRVYSGHVDLRQCLEAALLWLAKNPIAPTPDQAVEIAKSRFDDRITGIGVAAGAVEWQRVMFLAPETSPQSFDTSYGRFEIDSRVPPGEIRLHDWTGPTLVKNIGVEKDSSICPSCGERHGYERFCSSDLSSTPTPPANPSVPTVDNLLWGDFERRQGVPEVVNGLFIFQTHNAQVEEAFKRGRLSMDSGAKHGPAQDADQDPQDEG